MAKAIILAGGVGSRLWPLSREAYPKQFLKLFDGKSLFQQTVERLTPIFGPENLLISTSKKYQFIVKNQMDELGLRPSKEQIVSEPESKGTLPAVLLCMKRGGPGKYGVFPSDHTMKDLELFKESIKNADKLAKDYLVSFGIVPTCPHTGYGYIKPGADLGGGFKVEKFVEKPNAETAKKYVTAGYFWNAGMLYADSKLFLKEVQAFSPEHLAVYEEGESAFATVKAQTMEYGVFEKTDLAAVVPIKSYWNDLGSFSSFFDVMDKSEGNVVTNTEVLNINSKNSLVIAEDQKLVGLVDIDGLVVVDTPDALLIGSRDSSQKVKELVQFLKANSDPRIKYHRTVHRPWGYFIVMEENGGYRIKRLFIYPGKRLTAQRHYNRSEHWVVVKGTAKVVLDGRESVIGPGESTYVARGMAHKIENPGRVPLEMIEVQIGEYISEDDVERVNDDKVEE